MEESKVPGSRAILRELGLRPSKGLGQNFLVDETVPPKILAAAEAGPDDAVIEIGPGVGVLTLRLAPLVRKLTAVELDTRLYPYLKEALAPYPGARLVEGNALEFEPVDLEPESYKLIANIPYYITSAILRHFLENPHRPERVVLMVQKEVAQRIVARPPDMSLLAVSVQFYGRPKIWSYVPAGAFFPPPKVDSAVLLVEIYKPEERPCPGVDEKRFFDMVRAGFSQKRKQLANSLASGLAPALDKARVQAALSRAGIDGTRRAESLSLQEWAKLYESLEGK
ncbi:MAG TPA: 16S rRNA (adenine(1518)-N(6)/adenine(1519)-N(6))-dimethyltransferase RsmA [Chloroflexia bacterium]|nr:16S rRNA (adenine(1518)-N(6)/adenine(1519)-N(6))-dimethyltransferase RsmA [Chloroflexia bacterium]